MLISLVFFLYFFSGARDVLTALPTAAAEATPGEADASKSADARDCSAPVTDEQQLQECLEHEAARMEDDGGDLEAHGTSRDDGAGDVPREVRLLFCCHDLCHRPMRSTRSISIDCANVLLRAWAQGCVCVGGGGLRRPIVFLLPLVISHTFFFSASTANPPAPKSPFIIKAQSLFKQRQQGQQGEQGSQMDLPCTVCESSTTRLVFRCAGMFLW
jgi:hypothetical protein